MTGQKIGRLTVLYRAEDHIYPSGRRDVMWRCKCDCGNEVTVLGIHLRSGHTQSCGCYREDVARDTFTTHNLTGTRIHNIWKNMKRRCLNKNDPNYDLYGGRGIKICDEWLNNFENFYAWAMTHGYKDDLTIDRIDVNGNYEPDNCRWATQKEQCNNTRRNINVTIDNETHTLKEWSEIFNLNYGVVHSRVQRGWALERALQVEK